MKRIIRRIVITVAIFVTVLFIAFSGSQDRRSDKQSAAEDVQLQIYPSVETEEEVPRAVEIETIEQARETMPPLSTFRKRSNQQ